MQTPNSEVSYELAVDWTPQQTYTRLINMESEAAQLPSIEKEQLLRQLCEASENELTALGRSYRSYAVPTLQSYRKKVRYFGEPVELTHRFCHLKLSLAKDPQLGMEFFGYHPNSFFEQILQDNLWQEELLRQGDRTPKWPVPEGELPIYWSPVALAHLIFPFLQLMESDRFNKTGLSLENRWDLPFQIFEHAPFDGIQQGTLFDGKKIQFLLSPETGHLRQNYSNQRPILSCWYPEIDGTAKIEEPLSQLPFGIAIDKLAIIALDPEQIELEVTESRLIHHGKCGERLEPFHLKTHWWELLATFENFSVNKKSVTLLNQKQGIQIPVPCLAPSAISPKVFIPGTVPANHYW